MARVSVRPHCDHTPRSREHIAGFEIHQLKLNIPDKTGRGTSDTTRGPDIQQDSLFSTVSPESRVSKDSPYAPDTGHGRCARRHSSGDAGRGQKLRHQGLWDVLCCANATPHVAQNMSNRSSAIDGRTSRHPGHAMSQRFRRRTGEYFVGPEESVFHGLAKCMVDHFIKRV